MLILHLHNLNLKYLKLGLAEEPILYIMLLLQVIVLTFRTSKLFSFLKINAENLPNMLIFSVFKAYYYLNFKGGGFFYVFFCVMMSRSFCMFLLGHFYSDNGTIETKMLEGFFSSEGLSTSQFSLDIASKTPCSGGYFLKVAVS